MSTRKIQKIENYTNRASENKNIKINATAKTVIAVLMIILSIAVGYYVYFNIDNILGSPLTNHSIGQNSSVITIDSGIRYQFKTYKNNIIFCNQDGIKAVSKKGSDEWSIPMTLLDPFIYINNKYILIAGREGREANIITSYSDIASITTEDPIITAKINARGYLAVVTEEKGYKGKVTVYNPEGKELYKWHSVKNRILDVDISEDGKRMAVCVMDTSKGKVSGGLMFFYLNEEAPYAATVIPDTLIADIKFYKDNSLVAIGDNQTMFFSPEGIQKWSMDYIERELQAFNTDSNEIIVLAQSERSGGGILNNRTIVEVLNRKGEKVGTYKLDGEIGHLDVQKDVIVFNHKRNIHAITAKGVEIKKVSSGKDIKDLILFDNKRQVLVVSTNQLRVMDL